MTHRRMILLFSAIMAAMLSSLVLAAPAQAATYRNIVNFGSVKCVDIRTQDHITVQLYSCNSNDNKMFTFDFQWTEVSTNTPVYRIRPKSNPTSCLRPTSPSNVAGSDIVSVCDIHLSAAEAWRQLPHAINGQTWFELQNVASGLCLTVTGGSGANGTIIEQNTCNITPADLWRI